MENSDRTGVKLLQLTGEVSQRLAWRFVNDSPPADHGANKQYNSSMVISELKYSLSHSPLASFPPLNFPPGFDSY